jgi:hypothetical protein
MEVQMSKKTIFSVSAAGCVLVVIGLVAFLPVEGAKPASALSLKASFEELWYDGENNAYPCRILNDKNEFYIDTPDAGKGKNVVKSGVEVKYYPPSGVYKAGLFTMTIDQSGFLRRYVQLAFVEPPSTDPESENESHFPGLDVNPVRNWPVTLETSKISFTSWGPLKADEQGILRFDSNASLDMDKMQTGESKYIDLVIEFNPMGEFVDRTYYLGELACVSLRGSAELHCVEAGQIWEIRPFTEKFANEPDNSWRLLYTDVQIDFLRQIKLRYWHMPFVLKVSR